MAIFSKPPGFLRSSSQIAIGLVLGVDQDHPAAELVAVLGLEGFLHVFGRDLDPARAQFPQGQGRVDDVAGILHRADSALLVEGAQPAFAADAEPLGDVSISCVDLGRRDFELLGRRACSIRVRLIRSSGIFLPSRATHSSASCWRVIIWLLMMRIGSWGSPGSASFEVRGRRCRSRWTIFLGVLAVALPVRGAGWRQSEFLLGVILRLGRAGPGQQGRGQSETETAATRDRDPLRSSRGFSPIPLVRAGTPNMPGHSGRNFKILLEIGQSQVETRFPTGLLAVSRSSPG